MMSLSWALNQERYVPAVMPLFAGWAAVPIESPICNYPFRSFRWLSVYLLYGLWSVLDPYPLESYRKSLPIVHKSRFRDHHNMSRPYLLGSGNDFSWLAKIYIQKNRPSGVRARVSGYSVFPVSNNHNFSCLHVLDYIPEQQFLVRSRINIPT